MISAHENSRKQLEVRVIGSSGIVAAEYLGITKTILDKEPEILEKAFRAVGDQMDGIHTFEGAVYLQRKASEVALNLAFILAAIVRNYKEVHSDIISFEVDMAMEIRPDEEDQNVEALMDRYIDRYMALEKVNL